MSVIMSCASTTVMSMAFSTVVIPLRSKRNDLINPSVHGYVVAVGLTCAGGVTKEPRCRAGS